MTKPTYYDNFTCTASNCPFTCCQQWRIAVDEVSMRKWKKLNIPEDSCGSKQKLYEVLLNEQEQTEQENTEQNQGEQLFIERGLTNHSLDFYTKSDEAGSFIKLCGNGFCPYLNKDGLCNIVLEYGEETISNTCHTFPREEHVYESTIEKTLALGCPAVVDLLWKCEKFGIESDCVNFDTKEDDDISYEQSMFTLRNHLIDLIGNKEYSLKDSIRMMFFILLDIFEKSEEESDYIVNDYISSFFNKSFVDELYNQISKLSPEIADNIYEQNELFLDISDSYKKRGMYSDILNPLLDRASEYEDATDDDIFINERLAFEPVWTDLEDKLRLIVAEEIYSTLYMPEGDLYSMVLKAQWLGMTYVVLKQMLFLTWIINNKTLTYEQIRQIICVLIRMTGYSEEDIEEYLENSFEDIIWEWGYMNLII